AEAARRDAEGTAELIAVKGRARTHGANSRGTADPGAVSFSLVVAAVADSL
ncbi:DAK2 domain-containing protein, partial [Phytoactinopolyspora endophytica]|uniref:DAK2 domain-containing protein n=1 Tax=Phytoactinopolyspora endophytica TaxID=1642495 RepID=UPI0013ED25E5